MRQTILALDPGKTTGWAMLDIDDLDSFTCGELDFLGICSSLKEWSRHFKRRLDLVAEEFRINIHTAKNTQQTWSLEVIGVARYFSLVHCDQDLIISGRPAAMNFSTDDRLKAMGWYVPGRPHGRAASRHLLHHLVKYGWWDNRLGSWEGDRAG